MTKLNFEISKSALSDLDEIWFYTASTWAVLQADRYYNLIIDEINYICSNVSTGKNMYYLRKGYRASKVKSHLIFYKVENDIVQIVRILHEQMDIPNRLSE